MGQFSKHWTAASVEAALERGDPNELLHVPIVVGMNATDHDRDWAEKICLFEEAL